MCDRRILTILYVSIISLFLTAAAFAQVTGTMEMVNDRAVKMEVRTQGPAPSTAIITMDVPAGVEIEHSDPAFSRFSKEKGQVQWLLKEMKPGAVHISVRFKKAVEPGAIKAMIRYKDPSGSTVEYEMKNRKK